MKILIILPFLSGIGGIQSSLLNLLNYLTKDEVTLCVFGNYIAESTALPQGIKIIKGPRILEYSLIDYKTGLKRYSCLEKIQCIFVKLLRRFIGYEKLMHFALGLYQVKGSYDVAIAYANDIHTNAFVGGANDIAKRCVIAKQKVAWIHSDPERLGFTHEICMETYKEFDTIVNVSYACKKKFDDLVPEYRFKSKVVYNMFNIERIKAQANSRNPYNKNSFNLVTVARIDNRAKRIDRILECCQKLKVNGYKNFKWYVVGDGPDLSWLIKVAQEKQMDDVLIFTGRKSNPYPYMKHAHVLVMTSDYEAHGMVLTESLLVGTPTICTNYPAASEIVQGGVNGAIVDISTEGVFEAITTVMREKAILATWRANISYQTISNELALEQFRDVIKENA